MRTETAFTLLEVLVAILITSMLITATIQTFREISDATEHARSGTQRELGAEVLLDRLERELVGTTLVVKDEDADRLEHPWVFVAEDRLFGTNDSDSLRFVTQTPARAARGPRHGALRMVSYEVRTAGGERLDLYRFEEPLPDQLEKEIDPSEGISVAEDLHTFRLRFRDEEDGSWLDFWDSTDVALLDRMPGAVEITVQLMEETPRAELEPGREHVRVVELPIRPLLRPVGDTDRIDSRCPDGVTVEECLRRLQKDEMGNVAGAIQLLQDKVTDLCWNTPDPSPELRKLHQLMEVLWGGQVEFRCQ